MEKTKAIAGWYHRLLSLRTKPASEIPFEQYYRENKSRLKILYPFLPVEQIKGKLFAQWKKHQPPEPKVTLAVHVKRLKKPSKLPVAFLFAKSGPVTQKELDRDVFDTWLTGGGQKTGKTFKGRVFNLSPKVPEVISQSQSSFFEKSILKTSKLDNANTDKRHPQAYVSFATNEQGDLSSLMYSPPSPFVLSDASDDQMEEDVVPYRMPERALNTPPQPKKAPSSKIPKHSKKSGQASKSWQSPKNLDHKWASNRTLLQTQELSPSKKKQSVFEEKGQGKKRKRPRNKPCHAETPDSVAPLSQCLEPLQFGTTVTEAPKSPQKRYCLFEDESVNPKPQKIKPAQKKSKSKKQNNKKSFSWSPTVGCSQQTPKLKKAQHTLFSQEKPETYNHIPKSLRACKNRQQEHPYRPSDMNNTDDNGFVDIVKEQQNHSSKKKKGKENQTASVRCLPGNRKVLAQNDGLLNSYHSQEDTSHNIASGMSTLKAKYLPSPKVRDTSSRKTQRNVRTNKSDAFRQPGQHQKDVKWLEDEKQGEHWQNSVGNAQNTKQNHKALHETGNDNRPKNCDWHGDSNTEFDKNNPLSKGNTPSTPTNFDLEDELMQSPDVSQGTDNILWHILFQLKNTAASSQGQSVMESSPAQSRFSEFSAKSPSTCAPSPRRGMMDNMGPADADGYSILPGNTNPSTLVRGFRKRSNSLCNMFDDSQSEASAPSHLKRKRYLSSETCPKGGDFSMLFNADTFI